MYPYNLGFIPAGELIYKNDLVLIRGGAQFTFNHSKYKIIPFLKITYLIK